MASQHLVDELIAEIVQVGRRRGEAIEAIHRGFEAESEAARQSNTLSPLGTARSVVVNADRRLQALAKALANVCNGGATNSEMGAS